MGADDTALWFAEHAGGMGIDFAVRIPQRLHVLAGRPSYPGTDGAARDVVPGDAPLLHEWMTAFHREAVPHDPPPLKEQVERAASSGRYLFWTVQAEPVSVAAIARRLHRSAAIAPVFTPPTHRGRGYAGSATAATVDRILAEGRTSACLFTDLRNASSNRCYERIGFTPYCEAWHFVRADAGAR